MNASHIDPEQHIGDALIYEDDDVRVWKMSLEPGQESHVHRHAFDYLMICIEGDKVSGRATSGQDRPYLPYGESGDSIDIPTFPGHTLTVDGGVSESAVNTGTVTYRNILVELKDRPRN